MFILTRLVELFKLLHPITCYFNWYYSDLPPPGSPSRGDQPPADDDSKEQEAESDKSIYTEHSYTSRGADNLNGSIINSVYNSDVSRIFIKAEPGVDSPLESPDVSDLIYTSML